MVAVKLLPLLLLMGCSVEGYVINSAIDLCKDHGGVYSIYFDSWSKHVRWN